jgi:uncharacterized membrane protein
MQYLKTIFFALFSMVICSFKAHAALSLSMVTGDTNLITETREFLLTGDTILLVGFALWIAYIVFLFPKHTLKKL